MSGDSRSSAVSYRNNTKKEIAWISRFNVVLTKNCKKNLFFLSLKFQSLPDFGCIGGEDSIVSDDLFSVVSISIKSKSLFHSGSL